MRDLLGKAEPLVRALKDFQASSVSWVRRDLWRLVSSEVMASGFRVLGGWAGSLVAGCEDRGGSLLREKMEGWRKE